MLKWIPLALASSILIGCGGQVSCDSRATKKAINNMVNDKLTSGSSNKQLLGQALGADMFSSTYRPYLSGDKAIPLPTYKNSNIRVTAMNEEINSVSCESDLVFTWNDDVIQNVSLSKDISYSVQPTSEGDLYVQMKGF